MQTLRPPPIPLQGPAAAARGSTGIRAARRNWRPIAGSASRTAANRSISRRGTCGASEGARISGLLKRFVLLALALCTLAPLVAAAHGNHVKPNAGVRVAPAWQHEASAALAVAAAPLHCPTEGGRPCGCHGPSCMRAGEPEMVDIAPASCALQCSLASPLLALAVAVRPPSAPLTPFPPRAPPVSS